MSEVCSVFLGQFVPNKLLGRLITPHIFCLQPMPLVASQRSSLNKRTGTLPLHLLEAIMQQVKAGKAFLHGKEREILHQALIVVGFAQETDIEILVLFAALISLLEKM